MKLYDHQANRYRDEKAILTDMERLYPDTYLIVAYSYMNLYYASAWIDHKWKRHTYLVINDEIVRQN
jgi:hypothetical protein